MATPRKTRTNPPTTPAPAKVKTQLPPQTVEAGGVSRFPVLPAPDMLRAIVGLSRALSADMLESELSRLVQTTLLELLPGRLVAVRMINPKTRMTTSVLSSAPLVEEASTLPITIERGGLDYPYVRENLPSQSEWKGAGNAIEIVDRHPLIFRDAVAGFSIPLLAGGEISGDLHVNYPWPPDALSPPPEAQDKALLIPIANHIAVVAHMRRLLRETSYLREYQEHLIDQANVLIVATDLSGKVTVWNRSMHRLTGFSRSDVLEKDLVQWSDALGTPQLGLLMRQVASAGDTATRELRLPTQGNTVLRAAFNVVIVKQANQPAAVLAIGQDVTALRALQSQVLHSEKLATLGQIAAGVAHEINNPLTSIQLCADAVARKALLATEGKVPNVFDAADLDRLGKIKEGAERIRKFAKELVTYARPSGTEREAVDINGLVNQALSFCEHPLDKHKAELEKDFHPSLPPIQAVRDQLLQVIINLVNNAAQALPPTGGIVRVRTWKKGNTMVGIAISDTGRGIRDSDRAQIFEPFFSTKAPGEGTGLGLSIVRNIVYSQGGQITFQSRYGGGTTFVLTLPVTHTGSEDGESKPA